MIDDEFFQLSDYSIILNYQICLYVERVSFADGSIIWRSGKCFWVWKSGDLGSDLCSATSSATIYEGLDKKISKVPLGLTFSNSIICAVVAFCFFHARYL